MSKSQYAQDSFARIPAGVKTAALLLVLGAIAIVGEFALLATHENAWPETPSDLATAAQYESAPIAAVAQSESTPVPAPAQDDSGTLFAASVQMPMVAWQRTAGIASAEAASTPKPAPAIDPSVPAADSVGSIREEAQPATF